MNVKGVEQVLPKADYAGRVQKEADEGAGAQRFMAELNQRLQMERRSVKEAQAGEQSSIADKRQEPGGRQDAQERNKKTPADGADISGESPTGQGKVLDVRA